MMVKVIGLTGSIAVGKSTVSRYLMEKGYDVVDADEISRQALNPGTTCFDEVIQRFDCLDHNGLIDRARLSALVFYDPDKKKQLENIIHPYVIEEMKRRIRMCQDAVIFLDIPLLFEAHLEYLCDCIWVVYVSESLQEKRLMQRNHISSKEARHLMSQQISIEKKKEMGDYMIDNSLGLEELYQNINHVIKEICNETVYE